MKCYYQNDRYGSKTVYVSAIAFGPHLLFLLFFSGDMPHSKGSLKSVGYIFRSHKAHRGIVN